MDADPDPDLAPGMNVPQDATEAAGPPPSRPSSSAESTVPSVPSGSSESTVPTLAEVPHEDPEAIAADREERARARRRQTARDMVLSMLVVAGAVLVLWLPFRPHSVEDPVRTVDPTPVVEGARRAETWPVLAPVGLSSGWRCTSARISEAADGRDVVHLGYLSPTSTYVGLEQSATVVTTFVRESTLSGRETGTASVAGTTWTTYENDEQSHRSLVRTADGATYVVVGTGPLDQLEEFASTLRAG